MSSVEVTLPPLVEGVRAALPDDTPIVLVGGAVRDLLLGRPVHDYDFILPKDAMRTARHLAEKIGAAYYPLDEERDMARLILQDGTRVSMDFAAYQGVDMLADLRGRDFTINAIAIDLHDPRHLIDPTGGVSDLLARQIRPCLPTSITDDPVRVLRAVRMATALDARLLSETLSLMRAALPGLTTVSPERMRDEVFKILDLRHATTALRILDTLDALPLVLPELVPLKGLQQSAPHVHDAWEHSLDLLNRLQAIFDVLSPAYDAEQGGSLMLGLVALRLGRYRTQLSEHFSTQLNPDRSLRALLNFAGLYHDVGKATTRSVDADGRIRFSEHEQVSARLVEQRSLALRLSNQEIERLRVVVSGHMRPLWLAKDGGLPSRKAIYHFYKATGAAGVEVCLLALADTQAIYGTTLTQEKWIELVDVVRVLLENWWERPQEAVSPPALISGHDVMETMGLTPGPRVGQILEAIREAQASGQVTTRQEALEWGLKFHRT